MKNQITLFLFFLWSATLFAQEDTPLSNENHTEAEFHVAINPIDSNNIILVSMVGFDTEGANNLAIYYTHDFGDTWSKSNFTGEINGSEAAGDPVVAFDANGVAHLVNLTSVTEDFVQAILTQSEDGGATWAFSKGVTDTFCDKPWMAIDRFNASPYQGNIYIPIIIDEPVLYAINSDFETIERSIIPDGHHIPSVVVSKDGTVFTSTLSLGSPHIIYVQKYTDGGINLAHSSVVDSFPNYTFNVPHISGRFQPTPYLSIDNSNGPFAGRLYMNYTASEEENPDYFDIMLSHSDDEGLTWSTPQKVNQDEVTEVHQFYSSSFINNKGTLVIDWYDRRNYEESSLLTDFYLGISHDGGSSFIEVQLNSMPSDFNEVVKASNDFGIGEYHQLVATNDAVLSFWSDGRTNDQDLNIYFAKVDLNNPVAAPEFGTITSSISVTPLYPLPAKDVVHFDLQVKGSERIKTLLTNNDGKIILNNNWKNYAAGQHKVSVSCQIPDGIYFLSILSDKGYLKTMKFIKM